MAWFKIDDGWWSHPKTLALSNDAVALWARAGSWSCQHLTDGAISVHALKILSGQKKAVAELVAVGYWDVTGDGWSFHDWDEYQEHSEVVKRRREDARERMRVVRANRTRTKTEPAAKFANGSQEVRSTPTRPDPTTTSNEVVDARKRATRIPDPFVVSEQMKAWAAVNAPKADVARSTEKFVNYWTAKSGSSATKLDWPATWRNWMLNDDERSVLKPTPSQRAQRTVLLATELPEIEG